MRKYALCFLLLPVFIVSCYKSGQSSHFERMLHKHFESILNKDAVIIIPNQGCGGCISYAEEFYLKHKNNTRYYFIFTSVTSVKELRYRLEINETNTFIDSLNFVPNYYIDKNATIYPCVLHLANKKIRKITYESPTENSLKSLNHE